MKFYRGPSSPSLVYFIQEEGSNYVKIGSSRTPETRLKDIQVHNPRKLELVRMIDGGDRAETILHAMFRKDRVRGEWFNISKELSQFMKEDDDHIFETIKFANNLLGKKEPRNHSFTFKAGYGEVG